MDAETLLKYFNQEYMARPVEEKEIQNTVLKSKDKEYKYLCKKPTIKKYCDSSACTRHVCGITPLDAEKLGYAVTVRLDMARGIDSDGSLNAALDKMSKAGVNLVNG